MYKNVLFFDHSIAWIPRNAIVKMHGVPSGLLIALLDPPFLRSQVAIDLQTIGIV